MQPQFTRSSLYRSLITGIIAASILTAQAKDPNDDPAKECQDFISSFSAITAQLSATKAPTREEIRNIFSSYPNDKIRKFMDVYLLPKIGTGNSNELNTYIENGNALRQCQSLLRGY